MTTPTFVDSVAAARDVLLDRIPGSSIEAVPVRTQHEEGEAPPFILVAEGGAIRLPSVPLYAPARVNLEAWGLDEDQAVEIYLAAAQLLHRLGPSSSTAWASSGSSRRRVSSSRFWILTPGGGGRLACST
jgi:hypothetical protein